MNLKLPLGKQYNCYIICWFVHQLDHVPLLILLHSHLTEEKKDDTCISQLNIEQHYHCTLKKTTPMIAVLTMSNGPPAQDQ